MKYFTSDWHLGHKNIIKYSNRPFATVNEMDDTIIENMISLLKKDDELYYLGDLYWDKHSFWKFYNHFPKNECKFYWVIGNHDRHQISYHQQKHHFTEIRDIIETKIQDHHVVCCHYPMTTWNRSHHGAWHLFGHHHVASHGTAELDQHITGKMFNVNCEFNNYKPYSENKIIKIMQKKPQNWDYQERR